MFKKGQSMSINVIIVAALALLVLVLLALIFTGRITFWKSSTEMCASHGGVCKPACDTSAGETKSVIAYKCDTKTDDCCMFVSPTT